LDRKYAKPSMLLELYHTHYQNYFFCLVVKKIEYVISNVFKKIVLILSVLFSSFILIPSVSNLESNQGNYFSYILYKVKDYFWQFLYNNKVK